MWVGKMLQSVRSHQQFMVGGMCLNMYVIYYAFHHKATIKHQLKQNDISIATHENVNMK